MLHPMLQVHTCLQIIQLQISFERNAVNTGHTGYVSDAVFTILSQEKQHEPREN